MSNCTGMTVGDPMGNTCPVCGYDPCLCALRGEEDDEDRKLRIMLARTQSYLEQCPYCLVKRALDWSTSPNPIGWDYFLRHKDGCAYWEEIKGVLDENDKV